MNYIKVEMSQSGWLISEPNSNYQINLLRRTFEYAILVLETLKTIGSEKEMDVVRSQFARSGTSVGANYEEAQGASSKKDFYN